MWKPSMVLFWLMIPVGLHAEAPAGPSIQQALARGAEWLQTDMQKWRDERRCGACHHAPLALFSLHQRGLAADARRASFLTELATWTTTSSDARLVPQDHPLGEVKATLSLPVVYLSLGLNASQARNDGLAEVRRKLLHHLRSAQHEDGSWSGPVGRPPIFATPRELTLLVLAAWDDRRTEFPEAVPMLEKSATWLRSQPPAESQQELALRVLWLSGGNDKSSLAPLVDRLRALQQSDGGWNQAPEEPSDAFATGQALVALRRAGQAAADAAVRRGVDFLLATQRPDGSWPMTSRPHPENRSRAENLNPITYAGTVWAVSGLAAVVVR